MILIVLISDHERPPIPNANQIHRYQRVFSLSRNKGAKKRVSEEGAKSPLKKVKLSEEKKTTSAVPQTVTVEEEITEMHTKEKPKKKKKKKVSLEGDQTQSAD